MALYSACSVVLDHLRGMSSIRATLAVVAVSVSCLFLACSDPDGPGIIPDNASVTLPGPLGVETGETRLVSANVVVPPRADASVTWQSSNPTVATVTSKSANTADITGVSAGSTVVRAVSTHNRNEFAEMQVTVTAATVTVVTIEPAIPEVIRGRTLSLTAIPRSARGAAVPGRQVTWASANQSIATVNAQGLVTGVAFGSTAVTATVDQVVGSVAVTVKTGPVEQVVITPANPQINRGGTLRLTPVLSDVAGNPIELTGKSVNWGSSSVTVVSLQTDGTITGVGAGQADVTATVDGKSGSTRVRVVDSPPASIVISTAAASVEETKTLQLEAVVRDAAGAVLTLNPNWISLDAQIATVSVSGLITGVTTGATPARIVASVAASPTTSIADTALITVTPTPVATVEATIPTASIEVGESVQATATLKAQGGNVLTGRPITWVSSAPTIASVNATTGVVTGVSPGSASITAQREGKSGSATVQVVTAAPDRVDVTPPTVSMSVGGTRTLTATVRDKRGATLFGCPIEWVPTSPQVATVNSSGVVTAVAVGTTTVTASCLTKQGSAAITVTPAPTLAIMALMAIGTSTPVNVAAVNGAIDVVVAYNAQSQTATSLDLLVDGQVASTVSATGAGCPSACRLPLNTAAFSLSTGAVIFKNGTKSLVVRLNFQAGSPTQVQTAVTFANVDRLIATLTPNGSAVAGGGQVWYGGQSGGGATVTVVPVLYSVGKTVASINARLGSGPLRAAIGAPFTLGFNSTTYPNYSSSPAAPDAFTVQSSVFSDGSAGPTTFATGGAPASIRVDFAPPAAPSVGTMPIWVNGTYAFLSVVAAGADAGVGTTSTVVGVIAGSLPAMGQNCLLGLAITATGSQLPETATTTVYRARASSVDGLGNRSCTDMRPGGVSGATFGVDYTPPTPI